MLKILAALFLFMPFQFAMAEYRVFELVIGNPQTKEQRIVRSTLDPFQYPGYYAVKNNESVLYQSTWMCWGDTSQLQPLCENPNPPSKGPDYK